MWRRPLSWVGAALCTPGALRSVRGLLRPVRARFGSPVPAPPGLSLDDRLQRRLHGGAPGQAAGPLLSLPLPHHHELHADLPQGTARGPLAWAPGAERAAASAWARGCGREAGPVGSDAGSCPRIRWARSGCRNHGPEAPEHRRPWGLQPRWPEGPSRRALPQGRLARSVCLFSASGLCSAFTPSFCCCSWAHPAAASAAAWLLISRLTFPGGRLVAQLSSPGTAHVRVGQQLWSGPWAGSHQDRPLRRTVDGAVLF